MSLFKKKEKSTKAPVCSCGSCNEKTYSEGDVGCKGSQKSISSIKVLGSGCKNCHTLYENTKNAVKELGLNTETEYITDMQKVMEYGVMSMPALVINEKVAAMGKVCKQEEVKQLLQKIISE